LTIPGLKGAGKFNPLIIQQGEPAAKAAWLELHSRHAPAAWIFAPRFLSRLNRNIEAARLLRSEASKPSGQSLGLVRSKTAEQCGCRRAQNSLR
jgi:hypothetical protein